jgi:hypothetical protein
MSSFRSARNVQLSIIDYLTTEINNAWSNITTVKSFVKAYKSSLPVVCIEMPSFPPERREIGSVEVIYDYTIAINIFAKSEGQKLDLAEFIVDKLKDGCTYYEFSQTSGDPETLSKVDSGLLHVSYFINNNSLDFGDDAHEYDHHRWVILVSMKKD